MEEVKKMIRAVINGQSAMKEELLDRISNLDRKLSGKIDSLDRKIDGVEERLTERIDKIGLQVARLEDDTPTIQDFEKLESKVTKIQRQVAKN